MKLYIADEAGKIVGSVEALPVCGVSFCDDCGSCMDCGRWDRCPERKDGKHRWVYYLGRVESLVPATTSAKRDVQHHPKREV
jgi:hypothetical protein